MTRTQCQSPLADRQVHQARTGSSNHGDRSALGTSTQTIPSIIVTDDLGIIQGTDTEPDACVHGSQNQEIVPSLSDIDDYVPWIAMDKHLFRDESSGAVHVHGTVNRIYCFLSFPAGAFAIFAAVGLLVLALSFKFKSRPAQLDPIWRLLVLGYSMSASLIFVIFVFSLQSSAIKGNGVRVFWYFIFLGGLISLTEVLVIGRLDYDRLFPAWMFGPKMIPFPECATRVNVNQQSLFLEPSRFTQPVNSSGSLAEGGVPYQQVYSQVRSNDTLCGQGFEGNSDLYGLGQRLGLYLQWTTAIVINNLLPNGRSTFRVVYLGYSLTVCITTFVLTFTADCTFATEIDILYWSYWGGFLCVFATSPSLTRVGSKPQWAGLDWVTAINYTLHVLMFYHAIYNWVRGYSRFARMPCGTFHFFLAPVLDPSLTYSRLRAYLSVFGSGVFVPVMLGIPIVSLILLAEIQHSIHNSTFSQIVGEYGYLARGFRSRIFAFLCPERLRSFETLEALEAFMVTLGGPYRWLRMQFFLPSGARPGIRLVTPLDLVQRKYVIPVIQVFTRMLTRFETLSYCLPFIRIGLLCPVNNRYRDYPPLE